MDIICGVGTAGGRPSRQMHIRDMTGTVTNELLLERMKTNQAEAVVSHISTALSDRLATKDDVKDMATKAYVDQALDLAIAKLWNKMLAALLAHAAIVVGAVIAAFFALA